MSEFSDELLEFSSDIEDKVKHIENEENTKVALIFPFLRLLGYDTTNPQEFKTEYTADIGNKKGEKVDIAIFEGEKLLMLIECKPAYVSLGKSQISQLYRYFNITPAHIGILTNGVKYYFYTDIARAGMMDETPFLEVDLTDLTVKQINEIKNFHKDNLDIDYIRSRADDLKYRNDLANVIKNELKNPSKEFTHVLTKQVYREGMITSNVRDKFKGFIKMEFNRIIDEEVNKRLNNALKSNGEIVEANYAQELNDEKESILEICRDKFVVNKPQEIKELFDTFVSLLLSNFEDLNIVPREIYISFKLDNKNIIDIRPQRNALKMWINMRKGTLNDSKNITRDVSEIGHYGNGDYEIVLTDDSDIKYILSLVNQAYIYNK